MRRFARMLAFAAVLWAAAIPSEQAQATTAVYLTEVEHAQSSDAIVLARIGEQRVDRDPATGRILTHTVVHVEKPLMGTPPVAFEVHQMGGRIGDEVLYLPGDATLTPGEDVLLFVRQVEGRWFLTALQQSKYSVIPSLDGLVLERDLEGGLFLRGQNGELTPFNTDGDDSPMTLARLQWTLADAGLVPAPTGGEE